MTPGDAAAYSGIGTFFIGLLSGIYWLFTKLIISPMIEKHIRLLIRELDDRFVTRKEIILMHDAADDAHKRQAQEIRDVWIEINALKARP